MSGTLVSIEWKPDRLLQVLLYWTAFTTLVFWLPFLRGAFDGPTYRWGLAPGVAGAGMGGDYWVPVLGTAFAVCTIVLGWRGARRPFHWLMLAWHFFLAAGAAFMAVAAPDLFQIQGDTLGFSISLAIAGPLLFGAAFAGVVYWVQKDLRLGGHPRKARWTRVNTRRLVFLICMLPIQFALLRFGEPDDITDQAGVIITILQWLLLGAALKPGSVRSRAHAFHQGARR